MNRTPAQNRLFYDEALADASRVTARIRAAHAGSYDAQADQVVRFIDADTRILIHDWAAARTEEERERVADSAIVATRSHYAYRGAGLMPWWLVIASEAMKGVPVRNNWLGEIVTPNEIKAEQNTVNHLVRDLDTQITSDDRVSEKFRATWTSFVDEWDVFLRDHAGWTDRLLIANYEKTQEYRERVRKWKAEYERELRRAAKGEAKIGAAGPSDTKAPPEGYAGNAGKREPKPDDGPNYGLWIAGGVAAVLGVAVLARR